MGLLFLIDHSTDTIQLYSRLAFKNIFTDLIPKLWSSTLQLGISNHDPNFLNLQNEWGKMVGLLLPTIWIRMLNNPVLN